MMLLHSMLMSSLPILTNSVLSNHIRQTLHSTSTHHSRCAATYHGLQLLPPPVTASGPLEPTGPPETLHIHYPHIIPRGPSTAAPTATWNHWFCSVALATTYCAQVGAGTAPPLDQEVGGGTQTLTWLNRLDGIFISPLSESSYNARDTGGLKRKNCNCDKEDKAIGVICAFLGIAKRKHMLEGPGCGATQVPLSAADTTGFQSEQQGSDKSRLSRQGTGSSRASVANLVKEGGARGVSKPLSNLLLNGTSSMPKIFLFSNFIKMT